MPINTQELLSLITQLCDEQNLQVTVKESLKGGVIAGSTTVVGGMLAGPIGLAVGKSVKTFWLLSSGLIFSNCAHRCTQGKLKMMLGL